MSKKKISKKKISKAILAALSVLRTTAQILGEKEGFFNLK